MNSTTVRDNTTAWIDRHSNSIKEDAAPLIEMRYQNNKIVASETPNATPTLAKISEIDDLDDDIDDVDVQISNKPYPGIDDGFFPDGNHDVPEIGTRIGGESDLPKAPSLPLPDEMDGRYAPRHPHAHFPYAPGYAPGDLETGTGVITDFESIPDVNQYQHKKTLAQGMMDLALFSANANQLRYVLESYERHPYYYPSLILISFSILLQIAIGLGLILNSRYNVKDDKQICIANKINNYTVVGIFLVTAVNVFVSAFGVANIQVQTIAPAAPNLVQPPT